MMLIAWVFGPDSRALIQNATSMSLNFGLAES